MRSDVYPTQKKLQFFWLREKENNWLRILPSLNWCYMTNETESLLLVYTFLQTKNLFGTYRFPSLFVRGPRETDYSMNSHYMLLVSKLQITKTTCTIKLGYNEPPGSFNIYFPDIREQLYSKVNMWKQNRNDRNWIFLTTKYDRDQSTMKMYV